MQPRMSRATSLLFTSLLAGLGLLTPGLSAQTRSLTYKLEDVWLKPDISHPRSSAQQMTGTFVWTYAAGKFENGTGKFTSLNIPWWGSRTTPALKITFDLKAIEFAMVGNYHGLGLDLTLRMAPQLSATKSSPIDRVRSKFTIEVGTSRKGHVVKGSVVPQLKASVTSTGSGCTGSGGKPTQSSVGLPTLGNQLFALQVAKAPSLQPALLLLGAGQLKKPVSLNGSCLLYLDPLGLALVLPTQVGSQGTASWKIPIPKATALMGVGFDTQALIVTKSFQLLSSNALRSTIGN